MLYFIIIKLMLKNLICSVMTRLYHSCLSRAHSQNPMRKERTSLLEQKQSVQVVYQDMSHNHFLGSLQIPRINSCLLQAGIVEQIISLSALDNPIDLVCDSTLAVCVDGLSLHFSKASSSAGSCRSSVGWALSRTWPRRASR